MANDWKLDGQHFESCTRDLVCPYIFLKPPTQGFCKAMLGRQIEKGYMDDVDLSRPNLVLWLYALSLVSKGGRYLLSYINPTKQVRATYTLQRLSKQATGSISCPLRCYGNGNY